MNSVEKILAGLGAVLTGNHFVYASGFHGANYVAKDVLYTDPRRTSDVCLDIATWVREYCVKLDLTQITVVSPVVGGVALSQWVTYHLLAAGLPAFATFADKDQQVVKVSEMEKIKIGNEWQEVPAEATLLLDTGAFTIKRSYGKLVTGRNVVVVEDILTTGKSAKATIDAVKKIGGNVVMAAAICNCGGVTAEMLGAPYLYSSVNVDFKMFPANDCPLCKDNVPINTEFGHGKAFLEKAGKSA